MEKYLPDDYCLKEGDLVLDAYSDFDFNSDSLVDLALKLGPKERKDGDTLTLVVFKREADSSIHEYKTFKNLYPVYFSNYSIENKLGDEKLDKLKNRYDNFYPILNKITFDSSKVILRLYADVGYEYLYHYRFNQDQGDWLLEKIVEYDTFEEEGTIRESHQVGTSIDSFDYFRYIEGRDF